MDALEVFRKTHDEAKQSFAKIEQASPDERGGLWAKLRPELKTHEQREEQFVYDPLARNGGSADPFLTRWHQQHEQQVSQAESLMSQIGNMDPREDRWLTMLRQLQSMLNMHIQEEETQVFPRIRQVWGTDKLQQVGGEVESAKKAATAGSGVTGALGGAAEAVKNAFSGD